jgi:serine-type D-Ala-D-Ala carboxypeptidase/endopeptidase (penicillin-binding protein 4)
MNRCPFLLLTAICFLASCSPQQYINKQVHQSVLKDASLANAHIGISLYDVAGKKYLYNYQGDKYFVPASNIKIATCYVGLKYLGDSLTGMRYWENDTAVFLVPSGDPSLMHSDFKKNPVIDFLQRTTKPIYITDNNWKEEALGSGWSWDDYNENYMVERSPLPVYGNILRWTQEKNDSVKNDNNGFDQSVSIYSLPEVNWKVRFNTDPLKKSFYVQRSRAENMYEITEGAEKKKEQEIPFVTNGIQSALELLPDTIGKEIHLLPKAKTRNSHPVSGIPNPASGIFQLTTHLSQLTTIHSQPTDSLLKPMMHRSDNFYAEQVLLMVSEAKLGVMSDYGIVDTLLKTDLKDLPQKPRWADGSGLSRFNLFTPQCFVTILNKMQQEFGMDRLKRIFATGGTGTLGNYFKADSTYIYAKTGTLSGVVSLSGYLYTKKNKLLTFSVLVNNHQSSATAIRRKIEAFLEDIRNRY